MASAMRCMFLSAVPLLPILALIALYTTHASDRDIRTPVVSPQHAPESDQIPWPLFFDTKFERGIYDVAQSLRRSGRPPLLLYTLLDTKYVWYLQTWYHRFHTFRDLPVLVIALDEETQQYCTEKLIPFSAVLDAHGRAPITCVQCEKICDVGWVKLRALQQLVSLNVSAVFAEMDIVFFKNPFPLLFGEIPDHTWQGHPPSSRVQCSECNHGVESPYPSAADSELQVSAHASHPRVNIGFFFVKSTPATRTFTNLLFELYQASCLIPSNAVHDQVMFDALLNNTDSSFYEMGAPDFFGYKRFETRGPPLIWRKLDPFFFISDRDEDIKQYAGEAYMVHTIALKYDDKKRLINNMIVNGTDAIWSV